jgi:hypothetical protein
MNSGESVQLKPRREDLFEKLIVTYSIVKFPASCGTEVLHHVHKSLTMDPNLTQLNPVHSHLFKPHSNTLFPYTPSSQLISFFPSAYLIIKLCKHTSFTPLTPNGHYSGRTANLQTLHFKYLFNKYPYRIF